MSRWRMWRGKKAPEATRKRVRISRGVIRRAGVSPWPWDAPVYRGTKFEYDEGKPPRNVVGDDS